MAKVGRVSLLLFMVISFLAAFAIGDGRRSLPVPIVSHLDPQFMPGARWNTFGYCDYEHTYDIETYCEVNSDDGTIFLSVDMIKWVITESAFPVQGKKTVADFIVMYGAPTGIAYDGSGGLLQIYWDKMKIYVMADGFSPNSLAWYMVFALTPEPCQPWRGFVKPAKNS